MNKEIAKKAFESAENELKEKQVSQLKRIVKKTLERIETVEKVIKELQEALQDRSNNWSQKRSSWGPLRQSATMCLR